jgi:hypothetical protein
MSGPAANTRKNPEPSLAAKENAQALKDDPQAAKELKEVDKEVGGDAGGAGGDAEEYVPSKDTDDGKDLAEGVELEPEDTETV